MPKTAPLTPAASRIKDLQARRLTALREMLEPFKKDAAESAGVSEHSWGRYEQGESGIDPIALATFCLKYKVPAEWVITGRLFGMPDDLIQKIYRGHRLLHDASLDDSVELPPRPVKPARPSSRKKEADSRGTATAD